MSPQLSILPQLEQSTLFNNCNFDLPIFNNFGCFPAAGDVNLTVRSWKLSVFLCPSNTDPKATMSYRMVTGSTPYFTLGDFPDETPPTDNPIFLTNGIFSYNSSIGFENITDGMSNTAMVSERLVGSGSGKFGKTVLIKSGYLALADPVACNTMTPNVFNVGYGTYCPMTLIPFARTPNSTQNACIGGGQGLTDATGALDGPSSLHPGGVNVAFADGSVKFLTDRVNAKVWKALATIAGGEAISSDAL
jgi:prepilin-type processing-associated H-X9-DG protein